MKNTDIPKWKNFERLVAAVHRADAEGAVVTWNESISGRQFDVVMRFRVGSYDYLTVVECKDTQRPIPIDVVEALVTKARDAKADKAVIVSSQGFQAGAVDSARRHGIDIFTLTRINALPDHLLTQELTPCIQITNLKLLSDGGRWIHLPDERNLPSYLERHLTFHLEGMVISLRRIADSLGVELQSLATNIEREFRVHFPDGMTATLPHERRLVAVRSLGFSFHLTTLRFAKDTSADPHIFRGSYRLENRATGEVREIPKGKVHFGLDTVFAEDTFYFNPNLEFSYYCCCINDGFGHLVLVESYQHGALIQGDFTQAVGAAYLFVEITDPSEITRLRRLGARPIADAKKKLVRNGQFLGDRPP